MNYKEWMAKRLVTVEIPSGLTVTIKHFTDIFDVISTGKVDMPLLTGLLEIAPPSEITNVYKKLVGERVSSTEIAKIAIIDPPVTPELLSLLTKDDLSFIYSVALGVGELEELKKIYAEYTGDEAITDNS